MRFLLAALLLPLALPACAAPPVHVTGEEASREAWDAWQESLPEPGSYSARWRMIFAVDFPESPEESMEMELEGDILYGGTEQARLSGSGSIVALAEDLPFEFSLIIVDGRMHLLAESSDPLLSEGDPIEGSVSIGQIQALMAKMPDIYADLGVTMPDYWEEMAEVPVVSWMHPVVYFGLTMEQMLLDSFDRAEGRVQVRARMDMEDMDEMLAASADEEGVDEEEFEETMAQMQKLFEELVLDFAFDAESGFPEPFTFVLDLPAGQFGVDQPEMRVEIDYVLQDLVLEPEFAEDAFALPADVTFTDYDFMLAMVIGMMENAGEEDFMFEDEEF